jgi:hypothetical protein
MRKSRVYCDTNLTPIWAPNPAWKDDKGDGVGTDPDAAGHPKWIRNYPLHDYMVNTLGFERMFMVYDGTINRAPLWCNDDLTLRDVDGKSLEWGVRDGNFSNPPQKLQVQMCAKLSTVDHPYSSTAVKSTPMIFDLENPSFDGSAASIQKMVDCINWVKEINQNVKVGSYYWPVHANTQIEFDSKLWKNYAEAADFAAPSIYPWNAPAQNPERWFDDAEKWIGLLDRFYSWLPKVAVIIPRWQIYWNDQALKSLSGKYVPFGLWQKIVRFLSERDCDLFYWDPGALLDDTAKKYIGEMDKYQV